MYSYRIPHRVASSLNIQSLSKLPGEVRFSLHMPHPAEWKIPVLCPSDTIKSAYVREGYAAYTYTEVQGAEWPEVVVKIGPTSIMACSNEAIFTALTRCTSILHIQVDYFPDWMGQATRHPLLGPILSLAAPLISFLFFLISSFPHLLNLPFLFTPLMSTLTELS